MKKISTPLHHALSLLFILLLAFEGTVNAQAPYKLTSQKMTVSGTSSMHDWTSDITKVDCSAQIKVEGNKITLVRSAIVMIAAKSIKSTKGETMDEKTYEALKSDKNPYITYKLTSSKIKDNVIESTGELTVAGVSKTVNIKLTYTILPNGDIHITGSHLLNMPDHQMKAPTAVMGTIKVGEKITIKIDMTLHA